ncbi:MAG: protein kinase [Mariniblastus sp.]
MSNHEKKLKDQLALDSVISNFEEAWNLDKRPQLEEWMKNNDSLSDSLLFEELLEVEIELRLRDFEQVGRSDYLYRFPKHRAIIQKIFDRLAPEALSFQNVPDETKGLRSIETDDLSVDKCSPGGERPKQIIGDYQLLEEIGRGGMGQVFRANQVSLNREVAIKLMRYDLGNSPKGIQRLKDEARTVAKLEHPNIITILDHGSDGDFWYFVMPLMRGGTLGSPKPARAFDHKELLETIALIAEALEFAHQQDVVHRDIKPANILLDEKHKPYVGDFGLARPFAEVDATRTAGLMGTPMFFSPEQASGGKVGPSTDIHAIGAMLYHRLSGKYPFYNQNTVELIRRIATETPQPLRELDASIPKDLNTITMKCLEKDPAMRYQSAGELALDIRRYLDGFPIVARPVSVPEQIWRWSKRNRLLATSMGLITCLLISSSLAAIGFLRSSQIQSRLKDVAQDQRDSAVKAAENESVLRREAELAKLDAEDAMKFANSQQISASVRAMQIALETGQHSKLRNLGAIAPSSLSAQSDLRYINNLVEIQPKIYSSFCFGDWDALDSSVSPNEKLLALVDHSGLMEIREIASGSLVKRLSPGGWHTEKKRFFQRIELGTSYAKKQTPVKYYTSVAWQTNDVLYATSLDGELVRFELSKGEEPEVVFKAENPLHLVRMSDSGLILVLSEQKRLMLLGKDHEVVESKTMDAPVKYLESAKGLASWISGDAAGGVQLLDGKLNVVTAIAAEGEIHDLKLRDFEDEWYLYVAAGEGAIQEFRFDSRAEEFKSPAKFNRESRPPYHQYLAFDIVEGQNQLVAMDNFGALQMWSLSERSFLVDHPLGRVRDNRVSPEVKGDWLSSRPGVKVKRLNDRILTVARTAGTKLLDPASLVRTASWITPSLKVGPSPQIVSSPSIASHIWAQDLDGTLSFLGLADEKILDQVEKAHVGGKADICSLDNGEVATAGNDNFVKIWQYSNGEILERRRFESEHRLLSVAVCEEKRLVASVNELGKIEVWNLDSGKPIKTVSFPADRRAGHGDGKESIAKRPQSVFTGDLDFSRTGAYLVAFGVSQECEIFETENFKRVDSVSAMVSGAGGISACFSPTVEHIALVCAVDLKGTAVTDGNRQIGDRRVVLRPRPNAKCINLITTHSKDRLVGLSRGGRVFFFSPDHFTLLTEISTPVRDCHSIAMGARDSSMIVSKVDGSFAWYQLDKRYPTEEPADIAIGHVHHLLDLDKSGYRILEPLSSPAFCVDPNGHLATVASLGWVDDAKGSLYVIQYVEGKWLRREVKLENGKRGTFAKSQLIFGQDGKITIASRQELPGTGAYNGRLVLLHEKESGKWEDETVLQGGNAGWDPFVSVGKDGKIESIFHCDLAYYQLVKSTRPAGSKGSTVEQDWPTNIVRGFGGYGLKGVQDSTGTFHFLYKSNRGAADRLPGSYMMYSSGKAPVFSWAKGNDLMRLSDGRIVLFDKTSGEFNVLNNGKLELFAKFPYGRITQGRPYVDRDDKIWMCDNLEDEILVHQFDKGRWRYARVKLEEKLVGNLTYCIVNNEGKLEIACYQRGLNGAFSIVELERTLTFDALEAQ